MIVGDLAVIIGFEAVMLRDDDVMIGLPELLDNFEAVGSVSVFDDAPEKKFMIDAGKKLPNCELVTEFSSGSYLGVYFFVYLKFY